MELGRARALCHGFCKHFPIGNSFHGHNRISTLQNSWLPEVTLSKQRQSCSSQAYAPQDTSSSLNMNWSTHIHRLSEFGQIDDYAICTYLFYWERHRLNHPFFSKAFFLVFISHKTPWSRWHEPGTFPLDLDHRHPQTTRLKRRIHYWFTLLLNLWNFRLHPIRRVLYPPYAYVPRFILTDNATRTGV